MGPFQGIILIEGDRKNPEQAIKAAVDACNQQPTGDNIRLSIFTDGSYSGRLDEGSYAIVWNRPTPGAPTHTQEEHREAWYAVGAGSINVCELLAVLLALRTMKTELQQIMAAKVRQVEEMVPATATIFTDSQCCLHLLTTGSRSESVMMDILRQCWKAAQDLHAVPGLCVGLELRWLPSHMDEVLTPLLHWKADTIASVVLEMRCSYHQVGGDPELVSKGKDGRILRSEDGLWHLLGHGRGASLASGEVVR